VYVMQQNTRLAIITLDAVRALNLPTTVPLKRDQPPPTSEEESEEHDNDDEDEPAVVQQPPNPFAEPSGYLTGILEEAQDLTAKLAGSSGAERAAVLRGAAVSLLIAYNGAALGYLRPARAFIEEAAACYAAGCSVDEIYGALKNEEFAQSGGVMRFGVVALPGERSVSATLFARWLSLVFMTLAQLGVPHPGAGEKVGWAWEASAGTSGQLDGSSAIEAHGLAGFVSSTLRLAVQSDEESGGDDDARMEGGRRGVRPLVGAAAAAGEEDDATVSWGTLGAFGWGSWFNRGIVVWARQGIDALAAGKDSDFTQRGVED